MPESKEVECILQSYNEDLTFGDPTFYFAEELLCFVLNLID